MGASYVSTDPISSIHFLYSLRYCFIFIIKCFYPFAIIALKRFLKRLNKSIKYDTIDGNIREIEMIVMKEWMNTKNWIAGVQWFFFIFANIVVIPITIAAAFGLSEGETVPLLQMSFIVTGLACLAQVFLGHGKPILEGQSGLWWGIFLTLITTASAQGLTLEQVGGSLAIGA